MVYYLLLTSTHKRKLKTKIHVTRHKKNLLQDTTAFYTQNSVYHKIKKLYIIIQNIFVNVNLIGTC